MGAYILWCHTETLGFPTCPLLISYLTPNHLISLAFPLFKTRLIYFFLLCTDTCTQACLFFIVCPYICIHEWACMPTHMCGGGVREQLWRMCSLSSPFSVQTELPLLVSTAGTFASAPSCWPLRWPFKVRPLHMLYSYRWPPKRHKWWSKVSQSHSSNEWIYFTKWQKIYELWLIKFQ